MTLVRFLKILLYQVILFLFLGCKSEDQDNSKDLKLAKYENGKLVYRQHCAPCHSLPHKHIDGPSLFNNLFERLPNPSQQYFMNFIKDSKILENSGDKYFLGIQKKYSVNIDHLYKNKLSDKDIQNIILYIMVSDKIKNKN